MPCNCRNVVVLACNKEILIQKECIKGFLEEAYSGLPFEVKNYKKVEYFADLHQSIEQLEQGKIF
jgi:hypothetical protein